MARPPTISRGDASPLGNPPPHCPWCSLRERRRVEIDALLAEVCDLLRHQQRMQCPKHGYGASLDPSRRASGANGSSDYE